MKNRKHTHSSISMFFQFFAVVAFWAIIYILVEVETLKFVTEVNLAFILGIPAVIFGIAGLIKNTRMERAAHICDYAIKFHSDRDLSESFHFLVLRYGNEYFEIFKNPRRAPADAKKLADAQEGLDLEFQFYDPEKLEGTPQERRLDNLLGFFDTLAYDYRRGLVSLADVSNVFGMPLAHFAQRKVINSYLTHVKDSWTKASSFQQFSAPVPYNYLRLLIHHYKEYCSQRGKAEMDRLEEELK